MGRLVLDIGLGDRGVSNVVWRGREHTVHAHSVTVRSPALQFIALKRESWGAAAKADRALYHHPLKDGPEKSLRGFSWEDPEVSLVVAAGTWGGRHSRECSGA